MEKNSKLVIVGAGGHARVVIELFRATGCHEICGCTSDSADTGDVLGVPVVGTDDVLPELFRRGVRSLFVAIGANQARLKLGRQWREFGFTLPSVVSPAATVSPSAEIGLGVAVMAGAVINASSCVADLAIVNTGAQIDHDCTIGAGVHLGPGSILAGNVQVGEGAFLGVGAKVIPGVRIGAHSVLGAGSVVIRDLPDRVLAVGVPARLVRSLA